MIYFLSKLYIMKHITSIILGITLVISVMYFYKNSNMLNSSLIESMDNNCPIGCETPTSSSGNCDHWKKNTVSNIWYKSCPKQCPQLNLSNNNNKCNYDNDCKNCETTLFCANDMNNYPDEITICNAEQTSQNKLFEQQQSAQQQSAQQQSAQQQSAQQQSAKQQSAQQQSAQQQSAQQQLAQQQSAQQNAVINNGGNNDNEGQDMTFTYESDESSSDSDSDSDIEDFEEWKKYKKLIKQRKHRGRRRQINDEDINSLSMLTTNYPYVRDSRCMRNSTGFLTNCGPAASNFPCLMNYNG
jgi:hypothetical protein